MTTWPSRAHEGGGTGGEAAADGAACRAPGSYAPRQRPLVISVAAGIRTQLSTAMAGGRRGSGVQVVRAMPNRPALSVPAPAGCIAGVAPPRSARSRSVLKATGLVLWVGRTRTSDVVTALSGSGPAYFFRLAELMAEAGYRSGTRQPRPVHARGSRHCAEARGLSWSRQKPSADLARHARGSHFRGRHDRGGAERIRKRGLMQLVGYSAGGCGRASQRELATQFARRARPPGTEPPCSHPLHRRHPVWPRTDGLLLLRLLMQLTRGRISATPSRGSRAADRPGDPPAAPRAAPVGQD